MNITDLQIQFAGALLAVAWSCSDPGIADDVEDASIAIREARDVDSLVEALGNPNARGWRSTDPLLLDLLTVLGVEGPLVFALTGSI